MVLGRPATRFGRVPGRPAVLMTKPAMWSRWGWVSRYVSIRSAWMWVALASAVTLGTVSPAKGPVVRVWGSAGPSGCPRVAGWVCSRMVLMALRWTPASTATTEPLAQPEATERTRKAVTLFSSGPPPEPWAC